MAQPTDTELVVRLARLATAAECHLRYPTDYTKDRLRYLTNIELQDIPGTSYIDKAS